MYGQNSSPLCLSSCFGNFDQHQALADHSDQDKHRPRGGRCRNLIARIACRGRRRCGSADFSYDPMSYALNFENDSPPASFRNFSDRLPASPPRKEDYS